MNENDCAVSFGLPLIFFSRGARAVIETTPLRIGLLQAPLGGRLAHIGVWPIGEATTNGVYVSDLEVWPIVKPASRIRSGIGRRVLRWAKPQGRTHKPRSWWLRLWAIHQCGPGAPLMGLATIRYAAEWSR